MLTKVEGFYHIAPTTTADSDRVVSVIDNAESVAFRDSIHNDFIVG